MSETEQEAFETTSTAEKSPAKTKKSASRKIRSYDLPELLETLKCGELEQQKETLTLLCTCRNPRYDLHVWQAIFDAYENGATGTVRDQAFHAIETLLERVKTDPRSQDLLQRLKDTGVDILNFEEVIPQWNPLGRAGMNGLYIPRYEPPQRSRKNRKR